TIAASCARVVASGPVVADVWANAGTDAPSVASVSRTVASDRCSRFMRLPFWCRVRMPADGGGLVLEIRDGFLLTVARNDRIRFQLLVLSGVAVGFRSQSSN